MTITTIMTITNLQPRIQELANKHQVHPWESLVWWSLACRWPVQVVPQLDKFRKHCTSRYITRRLETWEHTLFWSTLPESSLIDVRMIKFFLCREQQAQPVEDAGSLSIVHFTVDVEAVAHAVIRLRWLELLWGAVAICPFAFEDHVVDVVSVALYETRPVVVGQIHTWFRRLCMPSSVRLDDESIDFLTWIEHTLKSLISFDLSGDCF